TEVITCRRRAPRQRSRASSRVRWATMMVKVLKIRNPPTSRATKAKASRAVDRNRPMGWLMEARGSAAPALCAQLLGVRARLGGGVDLVEAALAVHHLLGGGQVEADQAGPAQVV